MTSRTPLALVMLLVALPASAQQPEPVVVETPLLTFTVPGTWSVQRFQGSWLLTAADLRGAAFMIQAPRPARRLTPAEIVEVVSEAGLRGRQLLGSTPIEEVRTSAGVPYAVQALRSRGGDGDLYFAHVAYVSREQGQLIVLTARDQETYDRLYARVKPALESARDAKAPQRPDVVAQAPPPAWTRPEARCPDVAVGPLVVTQPVSFRVIWADSLGDLGADGGRGADVRFCRLPDGVAFACLEGRGAAGRWPELVQAVQRLQPDRQGPRSSAVRFDTVGPLLDPLVRLDEGRVGWSQDGPMAGRLWSFQDLCCDAAGNLYFGARWGHRWWFLSARRDTGRMELVAPQSWLAAQLGRGPGADLGTTSATLRAGPNGNVWAFLTAPLAGRLSAVYRLGRDPAGAWTPRRLRLEPSVTPAVSAQPDLLQAPQGCPDRWGGWLFGSRDHLWRIDPDGRVRPLARVLLHVANAALSQPVALPNGDIWLAWVGHDAPGAAGAGSGWLRLRLSAEGVGVGTIAGGALLREIAGTGRVALHGDVLRTPVLREDFTGGAGALLGYDAESGALFSVLPLD